ncbi:hypothetical protein DFH07DRAFT_736594, partial [Mycena maculata]
TNFADWLNDCIPGGRKFIYRQSQCLFIEHFSRRLLIFHKKQGFSCAAHPSTRLLTGAVHGAIGVNGGVLDAAMKHGCTGCTHLKCYRSDLIAEGAVLGEDHDLAGLDAEAGADNVCYSCTNIPAANGVEPLGLPPPSQREAPPAGSPRGYVRMAVMDGKTIRHRKCVLDECEKPLVSYKNGQFCKVQLNLCDVCGIVPVGSVRNPGALTCATESHIQWQRQYDNRFSRLSFPGVQRVIRRQHGLEETGHGVHSPTLAVSLPTLGETPGDQVVHTFKAKSIYCLQTVQLACGFPIGWGKCFRSESSPQVVAILNRIWSDYSDSKPSFVAYNDACSLLRHIATQNVHDPWLTSTKFIAWHYIGHRATDILCRFWCNPAPTKGSQLDLILIETDANGVPHQTCAFNTETAEQLNSWLSGFESQLRQMSDVNYDFFVHVLMMIYGERIEKKVADKGSGLSEEFWTEATSN